jgi:DNA-binding response OmpR family regulator
MDQTVLIIDDDADLLQLASLLFKKAGAQVITAHDGLDGISKFFTHHPDLVILDVMMPGNSGFDICQRIRQVSEAPLIFLTALNQEKEMLQGLAAGADDFLTKPFNPGLLVYLARNAGKLLTFDKILANVWGSEYQGSIDYVHVYISHLRRKIEQGSGDARYISTVHGEGYIFEKRDLIYKS